jgi:UDP-perosamine 4-acetyltransferase
MNKIIIIGAGEGGRLLSQLIIEQTDYSIEGFADDNPDLLGKTINGHKVVSDIKGLIKFKDCGFVVSLGMNVARRGQIFKSAQTAGLKAINIIDKSAIVSPTAKLGKGIVILAKVFIGPFVQIDDNGFIFSATVIEHDSKIADSVSFAPRVTLAGGVKVANNVFFGVNSTVIDHISIGSNVVVGAGALVRNDIEDNLVVAGVPAKTIKNNE